ncbi:MAG: M1 family aminopeptidase, partial [Bacteroidota bacterium]
RIAITVDPGTSGAITNGSVTTYFKTTAASVAKIGFDFNSNMTVSSITYHGSTVSYTFSSSVITITFPAAITPVNTLDSVTINYSGTPVAPTTSVPSGYNYSSTSKAIYTLGEAYTGHNWWPCKDSLTDKIDSVDLIVTTPSGYRAAGNGVVTETTSGSNRICTWKTRYRIATYMINFAAADYTNYQYTITTGGVNMPVMNYLYSSDNNATYKANTDVIKNILPVYVSVLNDNYPFLNEKYGIADCFGNWGALEVQSMTFCSSSSFDDYTLAHELAHQWFADKLTTNDWHQIWLNEGFAQYFQSVIYPENLKSASTAATQRSNLKTSVSNSSTTYVSDISTVDKIFIGSTTQPYQKGAMILSMLRSWLGDANFFTALKNYLNGPGIAYNFTSVDSLQKYMEPVIANLSLNNFFNDWVMKKGRATYAVKYQYVTNGVYIQLTQSPTSSGQGYFDMPVPIQIKNASGLDTTITITDRRGVLYNNVTGKSYGSNTIYYKLSATPTVAPVFDPKNVVLATASSTTASSSLNALVTLPFKEIKLSATPGDDYIKLYWLINTDESLQSIVVEKSNNGTNFSVLNNFSPIQTHANQYEGETKDASANETQYYRLKIVKDDGSFVYSAITIVNGKQLKQLQLFPNPVKSELMIVIPSGFNNNHQELMITNTSGQNVKQILSGIDNLKTIPVLIPGLVPGVYNITLINGVGERLYGKFVKQR